jgi:hypothetical protein
VVVEISETLLGIEPEDGPKVFIWRNSMKPLK